MSLLSSYTSANKVEQTALTVRYSVQLVDYTYYRVTRTAEKEYAYTGMTRTAAESCKLAKIAQYTRLQYNANGEHDAQGVPALLSHTALMATVSKSHGDGDSWNVSIHVSEEDVRAQKTAPTDPSSLFSVENARDYDETAGVAYGITITASTYNDTDKGVITYTQTIPDFSKDGVVIQYKATESALEWANLTPATITSSRITTETCCAFVRLVYGRFVSSTIATVIT